ncbi:neuronal acetylcholine receptor subunit alpha-10-like [Lineus longissimus]|uniref:neuronal acetylcholine receptor subunit alpha-10-like n=1 Tax=Lineus longissimus TaxID=88925 RepID=UPI00315C7230
MSMLPFDTQRCPIYVQSSTQRFDVLQLNSKNHSLVEYVENTEWELGGVEQETGLKSYSVNIGDGDKTVTDTYSQLTITITIKRLTKYYWVQLIAPCLFIPILVDMTFLMPAEAGEKISFSVTVLLSFTVYQLMIAEDLPKSSQSTPLLIVFLTLMIGLSASAVMLAIFVLTIHHQNPDRPLPNWFRILVFGGLAKVTCKSKHVRANGWNTKRVTVHPRRTK